MPEVVTAGTFTVTTIITSEITTPAIQPPTALRPSLPSPDIGSVMSREGSGVRSPAPNAPTSLWAITRTENTNAAIVYSGTWTVVNNVVSIRASNGDYTWADAVNEMATFAFTGPWINLGFATASNTGQADILIDGVNAGLVDTYSRDNDVMSFIFDNLSAGSHTVTIRVRGTRHSNSTGNTIALDYIDVWDGTDMPTGRIEQDHPRVWRSASWSDVADAAASGGTYMGDSGTTDATAWFPFTGDSISFIGFADFGAHRIGISIDGVWRGYFNTYAPDGEQRPISFNNLSPGPHHAGAPLQQPVRVDAFETPGFPPFYTPPTPAASRATKSIIRPYV
jgi:hypothetical protein